MTGCSPGLFSDPVEVMPDVWLLPRFADSGALSDALERVVAQAPVRHMTTPRGFQMGVATSNCGGCGWVSDRRGYRYSETDPQTGEAWPSMPTCFDRLARSAASACGFAGYLPDACLINRYAVGKGMGAHQDRDEAALDQPIVSVSLGLPARFFVVGPERRGRATPVDVSDGDVVVFGGVARLHYHGVRPLKPGCHPRHAEVRWNLTFRRARPMPVAGIDSR